ncbi:MAG: PepSY domain-containing protein [Hyphomicrobium sp.]|nr:PepSY domain-containing protein [Hyphomicrobium sp.]
MLFYKPVSLRQIAWRPIWMLVHRWAGLFIAFFLIVAGLTGSLLAFNNELNAWLNPGLVRVPVRNQEMLSPDELVTRVEAAYPSAYVRSVTTNIRPGDSAVVDFDLKAGAQPLDFSEMYVDPYDARVLGTRTWGAIQFDAPHFMPMIYRLHYTLLIPGQWGVWLFGIAAIVWFIDCFVGFYLTLPLRRAPSASRAPSVMRRLEKSWWSRWWPAWKIKTTGSAYRVKFDLHRAGALWTWTLLALMAFSSVYLNLREEVFRPVVSLFGQVTEYPTDLMIEQTPTPREQLIGFNKALAKGLEQVPEISRDMRVDFVMHYPTYRIYRVGFRSEGIGYELFKLRSLDLFVDDRTGAYIASGGYDGGTAADKFMDWQFPIHSGQILGFAGRVIICIMGLVVVMLSITGVVIWERKRRASRARRLKR